MNTHLTSFHSITVKIAWVSGNKVIVETKQSCCEPENVQIDNISEILEQQKALVTIEKEDIKGIDCKCGPKCCECETIDGETIT